MKKFVMIALFLILLLFPLRIQAKGPYILDEGGILTTEEKNELEDRVERIARIYGEELYFVLLDGEVYPSAEEMTNVLLEDITGENVLLTVTVTSGKEAGVMLYGEKGNAVLRLDEEAHHEMLEGYNAAATYYEGIRAWYKAAEAHLQVRASQYPYVLDRAGILTEDQAKQLNSELEALSRKLNCSIALATEYRAEGDLQAHAEKLMEENWGNDGTLLLYTADDGEGNRDLRLVTMGSAIEKLNDQEIDSLLNSVAEQITNGDPLKAFSLYGETVASEYEKEASPQKEKKELSPLWIPGDLAIGTGISALYMNREKSKLKNARKAKSAEKYTSKDDFRLTASEDLYLYTEIVKEERKATEKSTTHKTEQGNAAGGGGKKF